MRPHMCDDRHDRHEVPVRDDATRGAPPATIWVRRPTAAPAGRGQRTDVPARPARRRPDDRDPHRPGVALVAADREHLGRVPPARRRRRRSRSRPARRSGTPASSDRKQIEELAGRSTAAIVGLGTCGSCTTFTIKDSVAVEEHEKPVVAIVCDEFTVHAHNVARHVGHARPEACSCCRTRSRPGPTEELRADRRRVLPEGARAARGDGDDARSPASASRSRPIRARSTSCRSPSTGATACRCSPPPTTRSRRCSPRSPYPADHVVCVLPPVNGVATVELVADQRGDGRRRARRVPASCSPRSRRSRSPSGTRSGSPPRRRACSRC